MTTLVDVSQAVRNQRKAGFLAVAMMVASFWLAVPVGHWQAGLAGAIGVALGCVNHMLTELSLVRAFHVDDVPTRQDYGLSSIYRLAVVTVLAVVAAVLLWPDGVAVMFGLALYHLIALVFTGLPLLREMHKW